MQTKKLSFEKKRKITLISIAIVSVTLVLLFVVCGLFIIYNEALMSSKKMQLKKAEEYASLADSTPKGGVVFVGDSIIEMYDLDEYYKEKGYINRGISSNESEDILNRLQTNVIDIAPKVIILHIGANDIGHQVSIEKFRANVEKIINIIQTNLPDCKLFIDSIYPTLTLGNFNSKNLTRHRSNVAISNFNDSLISLCNTYGIDYINTHNQLLEDGKLKRTYTLDGLHISDAGYKRVTATIDKVINQALTPPPPTEE